jgi:hypothetical protein
MVYMETILNTLPFYFPYIVHLRQQSLYLKHAFMMDCNTITPHRQNFNLSPTAYNAYIICSILETIVWNIKFCQKL